MLETLKKVVRNTMNTEMTGYHAGYDMWNWIQGVGMIAIFKAYEITGDDDYYKFISDWVDHHLDKGLPEININTTVPMNVVLEMYKVTKDEKYKSLCKLYADYCISEAPRTDEGAFEHTVLAAKWKNQIWADTLFMGALFLANWGAFIGEDLYIKEAARQMRLHYKYLIDQETGLMYHGYDCQAKNHMSGIKWGRANGWHFLSAIEILKVMPDTFRERDMIIKNMKEHLDALIKYQAPSGLWRTVIDCEDSYEEMTVTCCIYYGLAMGMAKGYLDDSYKEVADKTFSAILNNLDQEGCFLKTSGPTTVLKNAEEYNQVPYAVSYYGQGIGLLSVIAQMHLSKTEEIASTVI